MSEGFSATLVESDREFCPFAALVFLAGHLPGLLRSTDFLSALRAFCHRTTFQAICSYGNKRLATRERSGMLIRVLS